MGWKVDRLVSLLINSVLLLLFILTDYKELAEVRLSLDTRKAHGQDTFYFTLVSFSVDKDNCDPDFAEGEWERWLVRDLAKAVQRFWLSQEVTSAFPNPCAGPVSQGILGFSLKLSLLKFLLFSISMQSYKLFPLPHFSLSHPLSLDSKPRYQYLLGGASFWKQNTKYVSSDSPVQLHHL